MGSYGTVWYGIVLYRVLYRMLCCVLCWCVRWVFLYAILCYPMLSVLFVLFVLGPTCVYSIYTWCFF